MKKLWLVLLCLCLLLAACGVNTPSQTRDTGATTTEYTPPATEATEASMFSGSTTAGGFRVHTDEAAYRPGAGEKAKYTRLAPGPLEEFVPSPDYGAVYPYQAARFFRNGEAESWETGGRWGLVDASGRILTDGIYCAIEPLTDVESAPDAVTRRYLPYWRTLRLYGVTVHEAGTELEWLEDDTRVGLVSMDGSFSLPNEYVSIQPLGDSFLCYRGWETPDFEVWGPDRQLRFTQKELLPENYEEGWHLEYGEGLYLLMLYGENWQEEYWFCDESGARVLGPYANAQPFREGVACVSDDGRHYRYIHKTGAQALAGDYGILSSFYNGRAVQTTQDGQTVLLDKDGKVLLRGQGEQWIHNAPCGYLLEDYQAGTFAYYDRDGKLLCSGTTALTCLDENTFWEPTDQGARIFRPEGPERQLPKQSYMQRGAAMVEGVPVIGYLGRDYSEEAGLREWFVSPELSWDRLLEPVSGPSPESYYLRYDTIDQSTNESWYLVWDGAAWQGITPSGARMTIPLRADYLHLRGDLVMAVTDTACLYLDHQGNVVFCYPLDPQD